jgi:hypothetical protein
MGSPRTPGFVKRPSEIPLPAPVFGLHLMHKLLILKAFLVFERGRGTIFSLSFAFLAGKSGLCQ